MLWRQGDVLIASIEQLPGGGKRRKGAILVEGEVTGHTHRLADPTSAELWEVNGVLYMKVLTETTSLIHNEHETIELPYGIYRVWQQREYSPKEIRWVRD